MLEDSGNQYPARFPMKLNANGMISLLEDWLNVTPAGYLLE